MLKLNNVTITFENQNILENINLEVKKGEIISIIGPSGSGKSTLIRCMNHMVVPSTGYVSFKDEILTEKNIDEIRQHIGMVFQAFELFPHLTVLDNLILATNRQLLIMNAKKLIKNDADLTRIGLNLAKLYEKIGEKNRG